MSEQNKEECVIPQEENGGEAWKAFRDALRGLKFGTVTMIVQDGVVIQVERTEKRRLRPARRPA